MEIYTFGQNNFKYGPKNYILCRKILTPLNLKTKNRTQKK